MSKVELEQEKKELYDRIREIENNLKKIKEAEIAAAYGDKYNCGFCAYNAASGFSCDGWHNTCGAHNCTCCHSCCDQYKPDNEVTLFIKNNIHANSDILQCKNTNGCGHIDIEHAEALKELGLNIFNINNKELAETAIQLLKIIFCGNKRLIQ